MYLESVQPHTVHNGQGSLYIVTGAMAGGKTLAFNYFFDKLDFAHIEYQMLKPHIDVREEVQGELGTDFHVSRSGMGKQATCVMSGEEHNLDHFIRARDRSVKVYGVAELHLFSYAKELSRYLVDLKEQGNFIVVEGLDRDFRGEIFEPLAYMMGQATGVDKRFGVCDVKKCNERGEYSQRIVNGEPAKFTDPIIMVGASEAYEPRCGPHHIVPGKPTIEERIKAL